MTREQRRSKRLRLARKEYELARKALRQWWKIYVGVVLAAIAVQLVPAFLQKGPAAIPAYFESYSFAVMMIERYPVLFWVMFTVLTLLALAGFALQVAAWINELRHPQRLRLRYLQAVELHYRVIPLVINEEHQRDLPDFIYQRLKFRTDYTDTLSEAAATQQATSGEVIADLQQVLNQGLRDLVILGRPGGGKTTLLRHSMSVQALLAREDVYELVPVYLSLPRLAPLLDADEFTAVAAYFAQQNERALDGIERFAMQLRDEVEHGRAILFLDGLDEVAEGSRDRLKRWIRQQQQRRSPYAAVIIGTRFTGYERSELDGFTELVAQDMDDVIRLDLATKLLPVLAKQAEERSGMVAKNAQRLEPEEFVRAVREHPQQALWSGNPLLFSLAAYVYVEEGGELPPSTVALYGQSIRALLTKVVQRRHRLQVHASTVGLMDETRGILAEVALRLYQEQTHVQGTTPLSDLVQAATDQQTFTELRLVVILERIRAELDLEEQAKLMTPWIKESGTLEVVVPDKTYTFRHHTYQEYLAAIALARRLVRGYARLEPEARHILATECFAPRWAEPMRMLAGALMVEGEAVGGPAGKLIAKDWLKRLHDLSTDTQASEHDAALELLVASLPEIPDLTPLAPELNAQDILTAWAEALLRTARDGQTEVLGRYQRLAPNVVLLPHVLSEYAVKRLYQALEQSDHPEEQIAAARALEGMGDLVEVVPLIRLLHEGGDAGARAAAARALARVERQDLTHPGHNSLQRGLVGTDVELARIIAGVLRETGDVASRLMWVAVEQSSDAEVRRLSVLALSTVGPSVLPRLQEWSAQERDPGVLSAVLVVRKALGDVTDLESAVAVLTRGSASAADMEQSLAELLPYSLRQFGFEVVVQHDGTAIVPPVTQVTAGDFMMGGDRDVRVDSSELPQHVLALATYQIGTYPVTVAEYACFVRAGQLAPQNWPSQLKRPDHPVVNVSWRDATAYACWLAELTKQQWRLPTEAEWEKAARGTDRRIYPWGNEWDKTRANTADGGPGSTTPVGSYPGGRSYYGVEDMAGNVWEWTTSLFKPYPYNPTDGREDAKSNGTRVLRGGSWGDGPGGARVSFRLFLHPVFLYEYGGFRLVASATSGS